MDETVGLGTSIAETLRPVFEYGYNGVGNQCSRGRCTDLIGDNTQLFSLLCQACNGAQKIFALRRVDPTGAHDEETAARSANFVLASEFA